MKGLIKRIIASLGYSVNKIKERNIQFENQITIKNFLDLFFSMVDTKKFFFVEIGANDGRTNDPLYPYITKYGLRGIVVEPQQDVFELLKATYKDYPLVRCINVAVAKESGTLPFYTVKDSVKTKDNYSRVTGIATFNKDVLRSTIKNKIPDGVNVDDYIQEVKIKTLSLSYPR